MTLTSLPGHELVLKGLDDLERGIESQDADRAGVERRQCPWIESRFRGAAGRGHTRPANAIYVIAK
jgi:hypothetical protein